MPAPHAYLFQRLILAVRVPVLLFASVSPITAQSTNSTLSGTVKDSSGAVVPKGPSHVDRHCHGDGDRV